MLDRNVNAREAIVIRDTHERYAVKIVAIIHGATAGLSLRETIVARNQHARVPGPASEQRAAPIS